MRFGTVALQLCNNADVNLTRKVTPWRLLVPKRVNCRNELSSADEIGDPQSLGPVRPLIQQLESRPKSIGENARRMTQMPFEPRRMSIDRGVLALGFPTANATARVCMQSTHASVNVSPSPLPATISTVGFISGALFAYPLKTASPSAWLRIRAWCSEWPAASSTNTGSASPQVLAGRSGCVRTANTIASLSQRPRRTRAATCSGWNW